MSRRSAEFVEAVGNIGGAAKPPLTEFLRTSEGRPHLITLTEAYKLRKHGKRWAKRHGYRYRQYGRKHGAEAPSIGLLVDKRRTDIKRRRLMRMRAAWWWGRSRDRLRRRSPRRYVKLVIKPEGLPTVRTIAAHLPPGGPRGAMARTGGKNRNAWFESARRIRRRLARWGENKPNQIRQSTGDFNGDRREVRTNIADPSGAVYRRTGSVDGVIFDGMEHASTSRIRGKNIPGHGWGVLTFKE